MEELLDDPLVLEAALALVDEWCADAEQAESGSTPSTPPAMSAVSVASMSPHGLRKRAREELTQLRLVVHQLQQRVVVKRTDARQISSSGEGEESEEEYGNEIVAPAERQVKARRLLHAVQTYNRVRAATRLTFECAETHTIRPVDDERVLARLRSRLDALAHIAQAKRTTGVYKAMPGTSPTLTGSGFQAQGQVSYVLPFKLSQVADVMWEIAVERFHEGQLSIVRPDEVFTMVEFRHETPWGIIATAGLLAFRRIYQADGSVIELYTSVESARHNLGRDGGSPNLLAGCVLKQAGWSRIERIPESRADRPLVSVDIMASLVVEALPGNSVSRDQLLRYWDAAIHPSNESADCLTTLENRLMDRQLAIQA